MTQNQIFFLLFLASEMNFSRTNPTVTNTWQVNPDTSCATVCVCTTALLQKACHAAACLLISSSHPQPLIHWASANIDALHVIPLMKNPKALRETTEGQQNYAPALVCSLLPPPPKMHHSAQALLVPLTYERPQRIPVQTCRVCGRVKM